jgi:hypothetical protein
MEPDVERPEMEIALIQSNRHVVPTGSPYMPG